MSDKKQKEQEFVVVEGRHIGADKTYTKGEVVSLTQATADKFPGKFRRVGDIDVGGADGGATSLLSERNAMLEAQNKKLTDENALQAQQLEEAKAKIAELTDDGNKSKK